jgi:hypothetical protein
MAVRSRRVGGEFQFVPENPRFGRVALKAVLPYGYLYERLVQAAGTCHDGGQQADGTWKRKYRCRGRFQVPMAAG